MHMPEESPKVAVDSHPRLSGIMDTINSTFAHGERTRLPKEFYDAKGRSYIDKIAVEEWYSGYQESNEYRRLGIGGLMGDVVDRMVHTAVGNGWRSNPSVPEHDKAVKFALSGCHDTTIAATLTALGGFRVDRDAWPNFTASIAFELFRAREPASAQKVRSSWWSGWFGSTSPSARAPLETLPPAERSRLQEDYYVRLRYNDNPVTRLSWSMATCTN